MQAAVEGVRDRCHHLPLLLGVAIAGERLLHGVDESPKVEGFLVRQHVTTLGVAGSRSIPYGATMARAVDIKMFCHVEPLPLCAPARYYQQR